MRDADPQWLLRGAFPCPPTPQPQDCPVLSAAYFLPPPASGLGSTQGSSLADGSGAGQRGLPTGCNISLWPAPMCPCPSKDVLSLTEIPRAKVNQNGHELLNRHLGTPQRQNAEVNSSTSPSGPHWVDPTSQSPHSCSVFVLHSPQPHWGSLGFGLPPNKPPAPMPGPPGLPAGEAKLSQVQFGQQGSSEQGSSTGPDAQAVSSYCCQQVEAPEGRAGCSVCRAGHQSEEGWPLLRQITETAGRADSELRWVVQVREERTKGQSALCPLKALITGLGDVPVKMFLFHLFFFRAEPAVPCLSWKEPQLPFTSDLISTRAVECSRTQTGNETRHLRVKWLLSARSAAGAL